MAKICRGFGMKVIAYDLFPNKNLDFLEYVSLDELLSTSDLISLHCPMTPETEHLINSETIAKMKDGVILVNTSRGGLIKTDDLIAGIRDHKFFAVGLDVYEEESAYVYEDMSSSILPTSTIQRLLSFPNVTMTSHQGFFTVEALTNIAETTLENAKTFMDGTEMKNLVHCSVSALTCKIPRILIVYLYPGVLFCSFDFNRSRQKTVRHRLCNKCALHPE